MRELLKQASEALAIGLDCAIAEATRFHESMRGYRLKEHDSRDRDVEQIRAALAAIDAALAQEPVAWTVDDAVRDAPSLTSDDLEAIAREKFIRSEGRDFEGLQHWLWSALKATANAAKRQALEWSLANLAAPTAADGGGDRRGWAGHHFAERHHGHGVKGAK